MVSTLAKVGALVILIVALYYVGFFNSVLQSLNVPITNYNSPDIKTQSSIIAAIQVALANNQIVHVEALNFSNNERYTSDLLPRADGTLIYTCENSNMCSEGSIAIMRDDFIADIYVCCNYQYNCKVGIGNVNVSCFG
jgi:hypothetical protein